MVNLLFTYDNPSPYSYGEVYLRAAHLLEKKGVSWACLDLEQFVEDYDFSDHYLQGVSDRFKPEIVISHTLSLRRSLLERGCALNLLEEEIETYFINNYWGRVQTGSPYSCAESVEFKEGFVKRMRAAGLPHPRTLLRKEVSLKDWNYDFLNAHLNSGSGRNGFYLKDISLQRGKGVHYVSSSQQFSKDSNLNIAQEKVTSEGMPYSVRIVTFPGEIIGGFFCYNLNDSWRSNFSSGYRKFVLHEREQDNLNDLQRELLQRSGLDLSLEKNEELVRLALAVSSLPSQSLLRGIDIVFDSEYQPYFIEAQTGSGNPWEGGYSLLQGREIRSPVENVQVAAEVIADCLFRHLNRK